MSIDKFTEVSSYLKYIFFHVGLPKTVASTHQEELFPCTSFYASEKVT